MTQPINEQQVSQSEFARIVGVSQASISQLCRRGILKRGGTLAQWTQAYLARLEELARPAGGDSAEAAAERLALLKARRELAEHEAAGAKQRVLPIDELSATLAATFTVVRQVLVSWCGTLPAVLQHQEPAAIQRILQNELHRLLEDLHKEQPRYTLRALRWLLKHAPADLWQQRQPFEDDPIARVKAAVDEQEAERANAR